MEMQDEKIRRANTRQSKPPPRERRSIRTIDWILDVFLCHLFEVLRVHGAFFRLAARVYDPSSSPYVRERDKYLPMNYAHFPANTAFADESKSIISTLILTVETNNTRYTNGDGHCPRYSYELLTDAGTTPSPVDFNETKFSFRFRSFPGLAYKQMSGPNKCLACPY